MHKCIAFTEISTETQFSTTFSTLKTSINFLDLYEVTSCKSTMQNLFKIPKWNTNNYNLYATTWQ